MAEGFLLPSTASRTKMIRKAEEKDIPSLMSVFKEARERMYESGNVTQWPESYPSEEILMRDISNGFMHVIEDDGEVLAAFSIQSGIEKSYDTLFEGKWPEGDYEYVTIHRVAGRKCAHHVLLSAIETAEKLSSVIRTDTHEDNHKMQALLKKYGFEYIGKIKNDRESERLAFQKGKN